MVRRRKKKSLPPTTELERELMELVWHRGEATVRDVLEDLNAASRRERAYTTVMTVMNRLAVAKGLLERRRVGNADVYRPATTREQYLDARAETEVGALVDEYGDLALAHFAREMDRLDPERARQLRALARRGKRW